MALKDLFEEGLEMYFKKDGRFIHVNLRILKSVVAVSFNNKQGQELAGKSSQAIKELSEHLKSNGFRIIDCIEGIVVHLS